MPLHSLLAVGPPLLTLVNFELENLAHMLLRMQWMVSGIAIQLSGRGLQGTVLSIPECEWVYVCVCVQGESMHFRVCGGPLL